MSGSPTPQPQTSCCTSLVPTLTEGCGRCWEVVGGEDLELDASADGLEADGEMQLRAANLEEEEIALRGRLGGGLCGLTDALDRVRWIQRSVSSGHIRVSGRTPSATVRFLEPCVTFQQADLATVLERALEAERFGEDEDAFEPHLLLLCCIWRQVELATLAGKQKKTFHQSRTRKWEFTTPGKL